jgi:DNA-binding NarL/FixJ family response regulator
MGSFLFARVGELGIDVAVRPVYTGDMDELVETQPVVRASTPQPKQPIRVLLVARHPAFLDVIARLLGRFAHVVVAGVVRKGENVQAQAQDVQADVVLFDLDLSGHPHLKTIHDLRSSLPEAGIIALSLLDSDGYRHAALAAGANGLIVKANLSTDLLPAIECAARASRPEQETGTRSSVI